MVTIVTNKARTGSYSLKSEACAHTQLSAEPASRDQPDDFVCNTPPELPQCAIPVVSHHHPYNTMRETADKRHQYRASHANCKHANCCRLRPDRGASRRPPTVSGMTTMRLSHPPHTPSCSASAALAKAASATRPYCYSAVIHCDLWDIVRVIFWANTVLPISMSPYGRAGRPLSTSRMCDAFEAGQQ